MSVEEENILDQPEDSNKKPNYNFLGYLGLGLTALGLLGQMFHFPGYLWSVLIGFALMAIRSVLLFTSEARVQYEWFYFLGKSTLIICLPIIYFFGTKASLLFTIPAILFLAGTFTAPSK